MSGTRNKRKHGLAVAQRVERLRVIRGDCWEVDVDPDKKYPQLKVDGAKVAVHRAYYEAVVGPIPAGLKLLHRCDNTRCHRPAHLFVGTQADNMADMVAKGRHRTKSPTECCGVMAALARVLSQKEIAQCFGISQSKVSVALRKQGLARGRGTSFGKHKHGASDAQNYSK